MSGPSYPGVDAAGVTELVEHVAETVVAPRFRELSSGDIREKSPGDLVTVVDLAAEAAITSGLAVLTPGVPVVGEEAVSADPSLLDVVAVAERVWLVDPIDGTHAFVEGLPDHAVMVALVERGEPVAGWICLPQHGSTFVATRGGGAWHNGRRLVARRPGVAELRGTVATHFLPRTTPAVPDGVLERVHERIGRLGPEATTSRRMWSGATYARIAGDEDDFALYWRTQPWDHAPGAVLLREMGGVSMRLDGSDYRADDDVAGLVVAASREAAEHVLRSLVPLA